LQKVSIMTPGQLEKATCLAQHVELVVKPNESIIITGASGAGKSSLFRVMAGLWPLPAGCGSVKCPKELMLVPQRPYFVLGSLQDQVTYPKQLTPQEADEKLPQLLQALELAGISTMPENYGGWNKVHAWEEKLSGGEQQRLCLARVFFHKPQFVVLDECTDAVNVESEAKLYDALHSVGATCITISKRLVLPHLHQRELRMGTGPQGWQLMQIGASNPATIAATAVASTPFDPIDEKFERLYRSSELANVFDAWEDGSGLLSKGRVVMIAQEAVRVSEMQGASIDQLLLKSHFKKEEFVALFMDGWDKWAMMLASQVFEDAIEQMVALASQVKDEQNTSKAAAKAAAKAKKAAKTQEKAAEGLTAEHKTQSIGAAIAAGVAKAQKAAAKETAAKATAEEAAKFQKEYEAVLEAAAKAAAEAAAEEAAKETAAKAAAKAAAEEAALAAAKATAEEAAKFQKEYEAVLEAAAKAAAEEASKAQKKANAEEATAEEAAKFQKEAEALLEAKAAAEKAATAQKKVTAAKATAIAELQAELESEVKTAKASLQNDKDAIEGKEALAVEDARIVFAKTTPDFEGNITHSELKRALKSSPKGLKERYGIKSWNSFFGELDTDGDGKISSDEFTGYCVAKALDL